MLYNRTHMATVGVKGLKLPSLYRLNGLNNFSDDRVITERDKADTWLTA